MEENINLRNDHNTGSPSSRALLLLYSSLSHFQTIVPSGATNACLRVYFSYRITGNWPCYYVHTAGPCQCYRHVEKIRAALRLVIRKKSCSTTGMALIAVGVADNLVSVKPFLEEQTDEPNDSFGLKDSLRIPAFCLIVVVPIVGAIALPYIKPWSLWFGIPAI
ncbi:hypothetical protein ACS0TY_015811 [Phlomoides rotata]